MNQEVGRYDKEALEDLYLNQHKGTREIALMLGVSQPWAAKIIREHGIPMRTAKENKMPTPKGSKLRPEHAAAIAAALKDNPAWQAKRYGADHPNWSQVVVPCFMCGVETSVPKWKTIRHKHVFCSEKCDVAWRKTRTGKESPNFHGGPVEVSCLQCGRKIFRLQVEVQRRERFFCCAKCKGAWFSANVTGDKIYNWRGGYEPYYGDSWKAARAKARSRDNHTCQRCGKTKAEIGKNLDVHHIVRFREFGPERHKEANALSNLITYCASCHKIVEEAKEKKDAK